MRRIDISCASQASTAVCSSMENRANPSSSLHSDRHLSDRAIDRHNPIIRDARRSVRSSLPITPPCSSSHHPPIDPIPYRLLHQKAKPNSLSPPKSSVDDPNKNQSRTDETKNKSKKKKRGVHSILTRSFSSKTETASTVRKSVSHKPELGDARTTPAGSTRYLLGGTGSVDGLPDHDPALAPASAHNWTNDSQDHHQQIVASKRTSSSLSSRSVSDSNQVVVLRVSLHCKGCEGKVRKHLSRMEGVTSFNIDFAAKKVTVVGDVTPAGVLASVAKVKNAQFWTSSTE
ncbi:hypothetical protein ACJRO7_001149 [Eucalyptus globulus]|uniref:HMA domain-containing protein n=1 Tax=Eucalyptus globulus TaxID=34317 RepID=A0ABD3LR04_EUCGL